MIKEIKELAAAFHAETVIIRQYLHQHPELSFVEYNTANFISTRLTDLGIAWQGMATTGIVAIIKGDLPSNKTIALRADIDALPITEANDIDYASLQKGVMHACGHDVHTASLLGTARILQALKAKFGGTVKLIFQPGEEEFPGGASLLIKEGVLDNPAPAAIIGQHVMPSLEAGKIGICKGKFMASKDDIFITVCGRGGHGAQPNENIDPVVITAHIIIALQQIVSRNAHPAIPSVLSFGKLQANGTTNVIPDTVYMEGTFRTLDEAWRVKAHGLMKKMAEGIAESMGGSCMFTIRDGYPFLVNAAALTNSVKDYAAEYLGKENIIDLDVWMASEDFAFYSQVTAACFYMLGTGNRQKNINASLHTSRFNIDEGALQISTGLMCYTALCYLRD